MKAIVEGHEYSLEHLDGDGTEVVQFVDRGHGNDVEGTNNQEVLRMLIDRVKFLNSEKEWKGNIDIIHHLRIALVLHEARHLERATEEGKIKPELISTGLDGHFTIIEEKANESI